MPLDTKKSGDQSPHSKMTVEQAPQSRGRLVVFLFGLAILHGSVINLMPLMFSSMAATFHVDRAQQGMLKSCFFAGLMVSLVISGYLTRYLGARRMSILAGIVAGAGAIFFGLAPSYTLVLVAASVLAMGIAPMTAVYAAVIVADFPHTRRRMYMWIYGLLAGSAAIAQTALGALLDIVPRYNPIFIVLGVLIWAWMAMLLVVGWRAFGRDKAIRGVRAPGECGKDHLLRKACRPVAIARLRYFLAQRAVRVGPAVDLRLPLREQHACVDPQLLRGALSRWQRDGRDGIIGQFRRRVRRTPRDGIPAVGQDSRTRLAGSVLCRQRVQLRSDYIPAPCLRLGPSV